MAKRKRDAPSKHEDPAVKYRARLEARRASAQGAQAPRWSLGIQDRLALVFARLLYTATAPTTRSSGLRKRLLERWLFRAATQNSAHRKALYRVSRTVLSAARAGNPVTFKQSRDELRRLWREVQAGRRVGKVRR